MKTILIVLLVVMGLYSCEKEPTSAIQEEKKYTLEEILADTNWVEIDTVELNNTKFCIAYEQCIDTVLKISNLTEYNYYFEKNLNFYPFIKDSSSSCYLNYQIPKFDFEKYDKFLSFASSSFSAKIKFRIFSNSKIKSYFYFQEIIYKEEPKTKESLIQNASFSVLSKFKESKVFFQQEIKIIKD